MCVLNQTLSNLVNVFFMMNTLSAIFVHCLKKDGSFSDPKKSKFHNFFPYFSPHAIPPQLFCPFRGLLRPTKFPLILPHEPPAFSLSGDRFADNIPTHLLSHPSHQHPFQGDTSGRFHGKSIDISLDFNDF